MWQSTGPGGEAPTTLTTPQDAHTHLSRPSARPPPYRGQLPLNEKSAAYTSSQPSSNSDNRDSTSPSVFFTILKVLAVITGISFLYRLLQKCAPSDRRAAGRAEERERRATERLYKSAARKHSWRNWWTGRKRGTPGYRPGDYEEKRALIMQQEKILEGAMRDEIRQLAIQEEIRQLRNTRDAVDDLVRAEEGRNTPSRWSAQSPRRSGQTLRYSGQNQRHSGQSLRYSGHGYSATHPSNTHPIPAPITIPRATSRLYPVHGRDLEQDDETLDTPLSATSSLPDYKTDAESEPPGYESDRRSSFSTDHGGESEYETSLPTSDSLWSPGSSVRNPSPRTSMDTAPTGESARTFL